MQIKKSVELALDQNSVELFLQPVVDSKTFKLVGAESLARIRDTNGQYIPPFLFIPVAEKNGRINLLGEQMFEKTCQFIKSTNIKAAGLSWINVNLSPIQILRRDLNERFASILNNFEVSPEMLHLEITEESMIDFNLLQDEIGLDWSNDTGDAGDHINVYGTEKTTVHHRSRHHPYIFS